MLQSANVRLAEPLQSSQALSPVELMFRAYSIARRHFALCVSVPAICLILAIIYLIVTPPEFTATSVMLIDTRKSSTATPSSNQQQDTPIDNLSVESQTEILKSENIALAVIRDLKLLDDPEFNEPSTIGAVVGWLLSWVRTAPPTTELERTRAVVEQFEKR